MSINVISQIGLTSLLNKIKDTFIKHEDTVSVQSVDIDSEPTDNSINLVTSGGVKAYIDEINNAIEIPIIIDDLSTLSCHIDLTDEKVKAIYQELEKDSNKLIVLSTTGIGALEGKIIANIHQSISFEEEDVKYKGYSLQAQAIIDGSVPDADLVSLGINVEIFDNGRADIYMGSISFDATKKPITIPIQINPITFEINIDIDGEELVEIYNKLASDSNRSIIFTNESLNINLTSSSIQLITTEEDDITYTGYKIKAETVMNIGIKMLATLGCTIWNDGYYDIYLHPIPLEPIVFYAYSDGYGMYPDESPEEIAAKISMIYELGYDYKPTILMYVNDFIYTPTFTVDGKSIILNISTIMDSEIGLYNVYGAAFLYSDGETDFSRVKIEPYGASSTLIVNEIPEGGLSPNVMYNLGTLESDTQILLNTDINPAVTNEYRIYFTILDAVPTISFNPSWIRWKYTPNFISNKSYEISINVIDGDFLGMWTQF